MVGDIVIVDVAKNLKMIVRVSEIREDCVICYGTERYKYSEISPVEATADWVRKELKYDGWKESYKTFGCKSDVFVWQSADKNIWARLDATEKILTIENLKSGERLKKKVKFLHEIQNEVNLMLSNVDYGKN